jgi:hypothetical protein
MLLLLFVDVVVVVTLLLLFEIYLRYSPLLLSCYCCYFWSSSLADTVGTVVVDDVNCLCLICVVFLMMIVVVER